MCFLQHLPGRVCGAKFRRDVPSTRQPRHPCLGDGTGASANVLTLVPGTTASRVTL